MQNRFRDAVSGDVAKLFHGTVITVAALMIPKIPWDIPVIGELKFDVNDVDRLYKYIQEA